MSYIFKLDMIDALSLGSAVMGSGGGGNPYVGALLLKNAMERNHVNHIQVYAAEEIDDCDTILGSAGMGSPVVGVEKLPNGTEYAFAVKMLSEYIRKTPSHISPMEIGGINSLVPFICSTYLDKPVIDGDGEGRAFPELQMTTFSGFGNKVSPVCVVNEHGDYAIVESDDDHRTEKMARAITLSFGGRGYISLFPMGGQDYRRACIPDSVSRAYEIGESLIEGYRSKDAEDRLVNSSGARLIYRGKITNVVRRTSKGFSHGYFMAEGSENFAGTSIRIRFQNEFLVAEVSNGDDSWVTVAETPEIISVMDSESFYPVTTERLKYGFRCSIFSIPVNRKWFEVDYKKIVGLGNFGLLREDSEHI
ncbi:MAG: DUF917 domain-containing protein [Candidatus Thermoplasmatota archaeon]|nr:DUF917 domain-containing protein [Candidatus Thermoplasmatota archaeon]